MGQFEIVVAMRAFAEVLLGDSRIGARPMNSGGPHQIASASVFTAAAAVSRERGLRQGSRMKACDPMLGANFREISAPDPA
jgi:hypothetical protein